MVIRLLENVQQKTIQPKLTVRLIQVRFGRTWYHYLTSVTDPPAITTLCRG
ncbi:MAG: hypothetical protein F6K00_08090 [Leptolyngbya sp. SIOISBB]|nr:hypothetical protein [Leptolyngbya sp. SIOISBB]